VGLGGCAPQRCYTPTREHRAEPQAGGGANVQLEHAKELLARAVRLEPTLAEYAQRWFDLVVLLLRKHGTEMQLENFRNRGRLLFPLPWRARRQSVR
jgi:hypothetical protein